MVRFVTDPEAIEKSRILYNKGFLPLPYCPLVCPHQFKCTFINFGARATVHYNASDKSGKNNYFMNHTFSFVIQHPLFNLHTS